MQPFASTVAASLTDVLWCVAAGTTLDIASSPVPSVHVTTDMQLRRRRVRALLQDSDGDDVSVSNGSNGPGTGSCAPSTRGGVVGHMQRLERMMTQLGKRAVLIPVGETTHAVVSAAHEARALCGLTPRPQRQLCVCQLGASPADYLVKVVSVLGARCRSESLTPPAGVAAAASAAQVSAQGTGLAALGRCRHGF